MARLLFMIVHARALFAEPEPSTQDAESDPPPPPVVDDARIERMERRIDGLERDNDALREEVEILHEEQEHERRRLDRVQRLSGRIGGYLDTGVFWAMGNGAGIRSDRGHRLFPEYAGIVPDSWVFVGDPLSTAVNARDEPADTDGSRAIAFDSIDARSKSSFIVNAFNLDLRAGLGDQLFVEGLIDFVPRGRDASSTDGVFLGDFVDVKLAYLRWTVPVRRVGWELYAGKIDSVFGREYRSQESPDRVEVTPSLVCRYTCGRPLGIATRLRMFDDAVVLAAAITNGSTYRESFGFSNEIDKNHFKTLSGRIAWRVPGGLEVGASGQFGAQDQQADERVHQWQYGFDLHWAWRSLLATAEVLHGRAEGKEGPGPASCDAASCLRVIGGYGLFGWRALNWLMPFARVDWRDALHQAGAEFVYISQLVRVTPGVRFEVGEHVVIKAQYTVNIEVGRVPQFPNDTFTTSVVAHF